MSHLKPIFDYLNNENIVIDKKEFDFQFKSHPDHPSLLAISDTLNFFNISNNSFKVNISEIELLPNKFVARLKGSQNGYLSYIEGYDDKITYTTEANVKQSISKIDYGKIWGNIVLILETHDFIGKDINKPKLNDWVFKVTLLLFLFLFIFIAFNSVVNKWFLGFYIFPLLGLYLSVAALNDLFKTKNEFLDKFCNASNSSSCNTIIKSSKWKILEIVGFSDLSIVFFFVQIVSLFLMGLSGQLIDFFSISLLCLLASTPVIATSIFYQKYVEKKWCTICLGIISVILMELVYVLVLKNSFDFTISLLSITIYLFVVFTISLFWYFLKNNLERINDLEVLKIKSNRFKRNYGIFKKVLMSSTRLQFPKSDLVFGNKEAHISINILTSPYCGYCKEPHYMLKSLLDSYGSNLNLSIYYNVNLNNKDLLKLVCSLINSTSKDGSNKYFEAMDDWYKKQNAEKWLSKYQTNDNLNEIKTNLKMQHDWFIENDINFTPCLFINGFQFPKDYSINDLRFFINELIDDDSFAPKDVAI
jgi:hypothetical protein